jgi:hypothetical protein
VPSAVVHNAGVHLDDDHTRLSTETKPAVPPSNSEQATMLSPLSTSGTPVGDGPRLEDGQTFGPYRIVRPLGHGGMGEVYEAEQIDTGRRVALKLLRGRIDGVEERQRFLREGQLAASISHPHTVYVFGSEEIEGVPAIAMQIVPGGTLKDRVAAGGPLPVTDAVSAILDVISGLDAAEAAGILHRDIKPSNCFIDADGKIKVGDFGLSIPSAGRDREGTFQGTPQFASPEQLRGGALDVRSDIYAVGATLHYLLTGGAPFESDAFSELITRVKEAPPPLAHKARPDVPAALGALVARCLAKDPADRPATYPELARALSAFALFSSPARLDARLIAGVIDYLIIAMPAGILNLVAGPRTVRRGSTSVDLEPWTFVVGVLYFAACEARWQKTPGKRLMGLSVTSIKGTVTWRQAAGRALTFYSPALVTLLPAAVIGFPAVMSYLADRPWLALSASGMHIILSGLLFVTMRRHNGFATVHDLLTGTRVVRRTARELRRSDEVTKGEGSDVAERLGPSSRRLGSFDVGRQIAAFEGGAVFEGIDSVLKRPVWVIERAEGAAEVSRPRRDVERIGRLHWLAGRRAPGEAWDAFEAPQGRPLDYRQPASWQVVTGWLNDLLTELAAAERDGTMPVLAPDRVWIRPDGRAVLLDVRAPGTEADNTIVSPPQLLERVGRVAAAQPGVPLPASAVAMLDRWQRKGTRSTSELAADLALASASVHEVTRMRRAGPLLVAASPVLLTMLAAAIAIGTMDRVLSRERFITSEVLEAIEEQRDPATREALKRYLATTMRAELVAASAPWQSTDPDDADDKELQRMKALANEIAALPPASADTAVPPPAVASVVSKAERDFDNNGNNAPTIFVALLIIGSAMSLTGGIVSVLTRPSGVVLSAFGLAIVTREGRETGRIRAVTRLLVAWSPLLIYGGLLWWPATRPAVASILVASLAAAPIVIGFVWSLLRPTQGPHDLIAGTTIGTR